MLQLHDLCALESCTIEHEGVYLLPPPNASDIYLFCSKAHKHIFMLQHGIFPAKLYCYHCEKRIRGSELTTYFSAQSDEDGSFSDISCVHCRAKVSPLENVAQRVRAGRRGVFTGLETMRRRANAARN